jgi:hypothetical protein
MPNCSPFGGSGYYFTIMLMQNPMSYGNDTYSNYTYGMNDTYSNYSYGMNDTYSNYSYGMNESYSNHSYNDYGGNMSYNDYGGDKSYNDYGGDMSHEGKENEIKMDMGDMGDIRVRQRGDDSEFRVKARPIDMEVEAEMRGDETKFEIELPMDVEVKAKMQGDQTKVNVELPGDMELEGRMDSDMTGVKVEGDGYEMSAMYGERDGGTAIETETKFDQYYMYSMDQMDAHNNSAPDCGPSALLGEDECKNRSGGGDSCCTHVVMTDRGSGKQQSFYRCMN